MRIILLAFYSILVSFGVNSQNKYKSITSGNVWFDQNNQQVNAHGGCIVKEGDKYYLFGEYKSDTANVFTGFSCYSSSDLMNWKFEKIVLPRQANGLLGPNRIGERVKVMKCPQTGEFVMYMHADDRKYMDPHIGYATCKTIDGEYQFQGALLHNGEPIRKWDMGTFQDSDGKGYLLIHHGIIYELSADYKSAKRIASSQKEGGESPTIFKSNGVYFWLSSQLTSWERNDNMYMTSRSIEGPWKMRGTFAPKGTLTWNSQCSFVLPTTKGKDTLFMYMGDRWSYPLQGSAATYVWQPILVKGDSMAVPEFCESWKVDLAKLNVANVQIKKQSVKDKCLIEKGDWKTSDAKLVSKEKGATITCPFIGKQVGIKAISNNTSGYARVIIRNSKNEVVINALVDFYSKYEYSSQKFLSPEMKRDMYSISIEVLGVHGVWSNKAKDTFGSTNNFVAIEDIYTVVNGK